MFLTLAIGLAGQHYSRTLLATITRAVNRLFMMPTPIFFRCGDKLTLAISLQSGRGAQLPTRQEQIHDGSEFDLITWLVIHHEQS
jgi:hypothetical protein